MTQKTQTPSKFQVTLLVRYKNFSLHLKATIACLMAAAVAIVQLVLQFTETCP